MPATPANIEELIFRAVNNAQKSSTTKLCDKALLFLTNPVDISECELSRFYTSLSNEEKKAASAFISELDSKHYIVAHGLLRSVLSCYSDIPPDKLLFKKNQFGKPWLANKEIPDLSFNLSHSQDLIGCLVILGSNRIGLDIERKDRYFDRIESSFSDDEQVYLSKFNNLEKEDQCIALWTLKEAYLKALGVGLSRSLKSFSINFIGTCLAKARDSLHSTKESSEWLMHLNNLDKHYISCVIERKFGIINIDPVCLTSVSKELKVIGYDDATFQGEIINYNANCISW